MQTVTETEPITLDQLRQMLGGRFSDMVKGVVDLLELIDLTLADPRLRSSRARLREIARAREVVADFFVGPNQYGSTAASLQKYFDAYALAARRR